MTELIRRNIVLDRAVINEADRSVRVVIATETPSMVVDWDRMEMMREILLVDGAEIPADDYLPLLDNHNRRDPVAITIKGGVTGIRAENGELVGSAGFSSLAESEWQLTKEGNLRAVSVGYKVYNEKSVYLKAGESIVLNGRNFTNDFPDKRGLYIRSAWTPLEVSLVPVGADKNAKFRNDPEDLDKLFAELKEVRAENEEIKIKILTKERTNQMGNDVVNQDSIRKDERERVQEIEAISKKFAQNYKAGADKLREAAHNAISEGTPVDKFRAHVFDNFDDSKPLEKSVAEIGMSKKEISEFSISRAITAQIETITGTGKGWAGAPKEREIIEEVKKRLADIKGYEIKGMPIPADVIQRSAAMTVGSNADGGYLVGTQHLDSEYVPMLKNKMVTAQAGVKVISGLRSNIEIPAQLTTPTLEWGAESFTPTAGKKMTFFQIPLSPKEGKATMSYSRKTLLQSTPSVDMLVIDDITSVAAIGKDLAVLHGAGGTAPTGIASVTGVGSVNGTDLDWAKVVEFETDVATANADVNTMKWVTNPAIRGTCKTRQKVSGQSEFLWEKDNTMNGYGSLVTNQVSSGHLFFGDWSQVILAEWGIVDILVNPYMDDSGDVYITVFVACDVAVRVPGSFSISDNVS